MGLFCQTKQIQNKTDKEQQLYQDELKAVTVSSLLL